MRQVIVWFLICLFLVVYAKSQGILPVSNNEQVLGAKSFLTGQK